MRYSNHYKFDYSIYKIDQFERPPAWAKIQWLMQEAKLRTHDYILWIDADAIFVRLDKNILHEIPNDRDILMVNHLVILMPFHKEPGLFLQCERPNTGILLIKTSD